MTPPRTPATSSSMDCLMTCSSRSCDLASSAKELLGVTLRPSAGRPAGRPCGELHLGPGMQLYDTPGACDCAFIVSQGLVERKRVEERTGRLATVGFSGRGDLLTQIGLPQGERELAVTVMDAKLIVVPRQALGRHTLAPSSSSPLERHLVTEMARDVKTRYWLRDIPRHDRLVQALGYLLRHAGEAFSRHDESGRVRLNLTFQSLSDWLGLDRLSLQDELRSLAHEGAISLSGDHLIEVSPRKLGDIKKNLRPSKGDEALSHA